MIDPGPARPASASESVTALEATPDRPKLAAALEEIRDALTIAVTETRPMLGAMLEQAVGVVVDGGTLIVTFGPGDDGIRRMLSSDDNARTVEAIASKALGRTVVLRVAGPPEGLAPSRRGEAGPDEPPDGPSPATRAPGADRGSTHQQLLERARKDPAVKRLVQEFGAQVIDVRPLHPRVDNEVSPPTIEENV